MLPSANFENWIDKSIFTGNQPKKILKSFHQNCPLQIPPYMYEILEHSTKLYFAFAPAGPKEFKVAGNFPEFFLQICDIIFRKWGGLEYCRKFIRSGSVTRPLPVNMLVPFSFGCRSPLPFNNCETSQPWAPAAVQGSLWDTSYISPKIIMRTKGI